MTLPSDEELFGDVTNAVERRTAADAEQVRQLSFVETRAALAKADAVLHALLAAGLHPVFGFDLDSAREVWATQLAGFDPDDLTATVQQMIQTQDREMPTLGETWAVADQLSRARRRQEAIDRAGGTGAPCRTCGGSTWLESQELDALGQPTASTPCPTCTPGRVQWIKDGHSKPSHKIENPNCPHQLCYPRKKGRAAGTVR